MLSAAEARQLDRLTLAGSSTAASANATGARVSRARGFGSEFHDFRHYQPGDDPRAVEWTVYGRLGQLVVRTFRADAHLRVHLLLDVSASMTAGTPDKLACARKLAALLGYVAVRQRDAVGVATFSDRVTQQVAPAAGRPQLFRVLEVLRTTRAGGASAINPSLVAYGGTVHGPGLVVVLSDFFDPAGCFAGVRYLLHRGLTPVLLQIVADEELNPAIDGKEELVDLEDATAPPLAVEESAVLRYRARLTALTASLGEFCASRGLPWLQVRSSDPFDTWVRACAQSGLLANHG